MSGLVELLPGLRLDPAPPRIPAQRGIAEDPAEEIAARFAEVAAGAVHALEVVAAIEAEGLTDRQIQQRYGREDAFELGEELFRRAHAGRSRARKLVPRRLRSAGTSAWGVPASRCALRGVLFALPGLAYVLGGPPRGSLLGVGAALLFSWSWSQGVAHLAYVRRGREDERGAARCLARGGVAGAVPATLLALLPGGSAAALAFALGQSLYFAAATALLVLGRERVLVSALTPMSAGALWLIAARRAGWPLPPGPLGTLLVLASLLLVLRGAWHETGGRASLPLPRLRPALPAARRATTRLRALRTGLPERGLPESPRALRRSSGGRRLRELLRAACAGLPQRELREAATAAVFGLGVAVLTLARVGPSTVALTLSMGGAEWFLARCRASTELALARAGGAGEFQRLVLGALARALAGYLLLVTGVTELVGVLWPSASGPGLLGLVALAAAIWSAQLLQSLGLLTRATATVTLAAAALLLGRACGASPATAQLAVSAAAALLLLALTTHALGNATRHR